MIKKFTHISFLLAFACCFFCANVKGQNTGLGIALIGYTIDTVNLGYTLTMNAEITNSDSTPFSGIINFGLRNTGGVITSSSVFDKPPYSGDSIYLGGHEIVPAIFSVNINPQYFTPGPDVVVVWPICTAPASDSIILNIIVQDPTGINALANGLFTYVVMPDKILFTGSDTNLGFEQVRIFDVLGREVSAIDGINIHEIPTGQLPQGVYVCQFVSNSGLKVNFKFFAR